MDALSLIHISSTGGQPTSKANDADAEHGLEEGTIIEDGDNKYTVEYLHL